jgi:diacylglycerol kinase family enzyme
MLQSIYSARHFFVVNPVCFASQLEMEEMISRMHHFFNGVNNSPLWTPPDYAVHVSRFPRDAITAIHQFANAVPATVPLRVYAVGGDGMLFDCLNGIVGLPNVELGYIPYGKEITFSRIFGGKNKEIFNSLEAQIIAPSISMDALYCGSNYTLSRCLIGLEALSRNRARKLRRGNTFLDHCMDAFCQVLNNNSAYFTGISNVEILKQNYRMWVDDENLSGAHAFISIANSSHYVGNKKTAILKADPTDGWMDVLASGKIDALDIYKVYSKYINGQYSEYPSLFTYRRAKKIFLTSNQPLVLDLDGESFYDKYISIEIKPKFVRFIDPTQAHQE